MMTTTDKGSGAASGTRPPAAAKPGAGRPINVSPHGRTASAAVGAALLARGLRHGGLPSLLLGGGLLYRAFSGHCPALAAVGVNAAAGGTGPAGRRAAGGNATADRTAMLTLPVDRPADDLYWLWSDPGARRFVLSSVADVTPSGPDGLHWSLMSVGGRPVEWDVRVIESRPGHLVRWESLPGAALPSKGFVRFRPAPDGRGTAVTLGLGFFPPGGASAATVLGLHPKVLVERVLRQLKDLAETGEAPPVARRTAARDAGGTR